MALGGTLMVIVCPSSILTRIWTSVLVREGREVMWAWVLTQGVFGGKGGEWIGQEWLFSPTSVAFNSRRVVRLMRAFTPALRLTLMSVSGDLQMESRRLPI